IGDIAIGVVAAIREVVEQIVRQRAAQRTLSDEAAEVVELDSKFSFRIGRGLACHEIDGPGLGISAEQRALRTTQDFEAIQIQEIEVEADMWLVGAVNEYADGRVQRRSGADATNRQIGEIFRRCKISLTEIETRGNREHVGNVCRSLSIQFFPAYGGAPLSPNPPAFLAAPGGRPNPLPPPPWIP